MSSTIKAREPFLHLGRQQDSSAFTRVLIHSPHCLHNPVGPGRSKSAAERCSEAAANGGRKAKPLDCHSDEWTVQLGSRASSHSSFSWINFPPSSQNKLTNLFQPETSRSVFNFSTQEKKKKSPLLLKYSLRGGKVLHSLYGSCTSFPP